MKFACQVLCSLLLTAAVWAQNPATAPESHDAPAAHPHQHGMRGHAMPDMKAQVEKMRATLEQMKANLAKIKKSGLLRTHAQLDVDLWDAMVQHMESMEKMMSEMPDMKGEMQDTSDSEDMAKDRAGTKEVEAAPVGTPN